MKPGAGGHRQVTEVGLPPVRREADRPGLHARPLPGVLLALSTLLIAGGCSTWPPRAPFCPEDPILEPSPVPLPDRAHARGELVVETAPTGFQKGAFPQRYRFSVFDEHGQYLDCYVNDLMSPVDLPPGRYVVVSPVGFSEKRVQVLIEAGRMTYVSLSDLRQGRDAK